MTTPFLSTVTVAATLIVLPTAMASAQAPTAGPGPATTQAVACVALLLPSVRGTDGDATALAASLRELIASFLTGPSLRTVTLDARLPQQAVLETQQKDCAHVLTLTITRKRSSGGGVGRVLGQAAGAAAWQIPYGSTTGAIATRGAVAAGAAAASSIASNTRAKDEMRIDYRLLAGNAVPLREGGESAKAKSDGEDILTPLIETVAAQIVAAVTQ